MQRLLRRDLRQPALALARTLSSAARRVPIYQVDAFAPKTFAGNPAAVLPLDAWLPDETLLSIASENNLTETAFMIARGDGSGDYDLRWFTPTLEVDMCGHATLASGAVVLDVLNPEQEEVGFHTRSGRLVVRRGGTCPASNSPYFTLDFPLWPVGAAVEPPPRLVHALGGRAPLAKEASSDKLFDAIDTDASNTIDRDELKTYLGKVRRLRSSDPRHAVPKAPAAHGPPLPRAAASLLPCHSLGLPYRC
jgi:hypothetical protein